MLSEVDFSSFSGTFSELTYELDQRRVVPGSTVPG